ncbi:DHHW family protein [Paenibacillus soyae]|uniref:DHHW family protein n=1 Tax=Paenibacillus soyae TaxID=2969249 RepID=A0A9X2S8P4_9BACL|nr:DHHW family protein [Paenibacillus soyae]MCR2804589.1 DHHW family protein [Paenibacillus soyae]
MTTKWTDRIYTWGFVSVLGIMSILFFTLPKEAFSETENRSLQDVPKLTWDRLWSKEFADEAELFVTDHFPYRTDWVLAKSYIEQLRLQQENNGIYNGKEGYLLEKFGEPDFEEIGSYADAIGQFAGHHPETNISFLLSPNSVGLYPELLPWLAAAYPQSEVNDFIGDRLPEEVRFLNGFDFLRSGGDKPLFYRTDHHWTTYGAYLAYRAYAESMGWEPLSEEQFNIRTVTDSFLGSYQTKGQFGGTRPDSIQIYEPKNLVASEMYIADTGTTVNSLYDESYLSKKDKYSVFQGGVHALVTINNSLTPGTADLDKLLIVKDSYAHSFLPFLTSHVEEIHMIDIRYYNGGIGDYMEQNGIDDVLLLFNTSTFVEERGLLKLKY